MKIIGLIALLFGSGLTCMGAAQIPGPADCTVAREQFAERNDAVLYKREKIQLTPESMKSGTKSLEDFATRIMEARLSDSRDPEVIGSYLRCMQEREADRPEDSVTNTPQVFITGEGAARLALSAMLILRGGTVIAQTHPFILCFAANREKWTEVSGFSDTAFDGHTLFIDKLPSPIPDEEWFLLSGRTIGDTGGRMRLEVVSCSHRQFRSIWKRDGLVHGEVKVDPQHVTISYEKRGNPNTPLPAGQRLGMEFIIMDDSADPSPIRFSETLRITKNGLEP